MPIHYRPLTHTFSFIFLLCALTACGFHLRGKVTLAPQLHTLYLQTNAPYGPLSKQLRETLILVGVRLVQNPQEAPLSLMITRDSQAQQATSFSPTTQIQTYVLTSAITYQINDRTGRAIIGPNTLTATRNYTANPNQAIGNTYEQDILYQDMRRDLVNQILRQLSSKNALRALNNTNP